MKAVYCLDGEEIKLGRQIGRGGEGSVYHVEGKKYGHLAAKIYFEPLKEEKIEKLIALVSAFDASLESVAAWPNMLIADKPGNVIGFMMPKIEGFKPIHELYNPSARKRFFPQADYAFLVHTARNLVAAIASIHSKGLVVGDINEGNILVSDKGTVKLIDCDSFQVSTSSKFYPCEVGIPMYTPPELQREKTFRNIKRTNNHDLFGLGVMCFQLLFMGRHPYAGIYNGQDITLEKAIERCLFAYGKSAASLAIKPPIESIPFHSIPEQLRDLFYETFTERGMGSRPGVQKWMDQLGRLKTELIVCSKEKNHKYFKGLSKCLWCEFENARNVFYFLAQTVKNFRIGGFNLASIWKQVEQIAAELDEPDPLQDFDLKLTKKEELRQIQFFKALLILEMLLKVGITLYLLVNVPKFFIAWVFLAILLFNIKISRSILDKSQQKQRNKVSIAKAKLETLERRWKQEASRQVMLAVVKEVNMLKHQYEQLPTLYESEMKQLNERKRELQLQSYLSRFFIKDYQIEGFGHNRKFVLAAYGIETAADIIKFKTHKIPGFGSYLTGELMAWRKQMCRGFTFDPSKAIDQQEINQINRKFEALKGSLQNKLLNALEQTKAKKITILRAREILKPQLTTAYNEYKDEEKLLCKF